MILLNMIRINIKHIFVLAGFIGSFLSCQDLKFGDDFLEKAPSNDVDIDVSRKHLRIFEDGSAWHAQGLGSTNGTTLISGADKSITEIEPQGSANKKYPPPSKSAMVTHSV